MFLRDVYLKKMLLVSQNFKKTFEINEKKIMLTTLKDILNGITLGIEDKIYRELSNNISFKTSKFYQIGHVK